MKEVFLSCPELLFVSYSGFWNDEYKTYDPVMVGKAAILLISSSAVFKKIVPGNFRKYMDQNTGLPFDQHFFRNQRFSFHSLSYSE
jgi:hypothetical protein